MWQSSVETGIWHLTVIERLGNSGTCHLMTHTDIRATSVDRCLILTEGVLLTTPDTLTTGGCHLTIEVNLLPAITLLLLIDSLVFMEVYHLIPVRRVISTSSVPLLMRKTSLVPMGGYALIGRMGLATTGSCPLAPTQGQMPSISGGQLLTVVRGVVTCGRHPQGTTEAVITRPSN